MMTDLKDNIRKNFDNLTKRQQIVAKYIIENLEKVAFVTTKELGDLTGTSEATVIRFSYSLGYSGFSEMQKVVQESVFLNSQKRPIENFLSSTDALSKSNQLIKDTMTEDITFIQQTLNLVDEECLQTVITNIIGAEKRFIVGFRSSHAPAGWLAYSLNIILGDAYLYRGETDNTVQLISQFKEKSVVIAISLPRYSQETLRFVKAAKEQGAVIIVVTDNELSPVAIYADHILKVVTPTPSALKGMSAIFSLLNVLISGVAVMDKENVQKRLYQYEQFSQGFFVDVD
ncbi:MurR/RpiR family transcriptional regulator [Fredinandcohnia onubensis]|uniref:MurR/RpiR family transcriptional regulator n=1 Tax=Fredinandcohnia onubensis TaxID=1571209 RepID=UPI000C0BD154|nr:MurR/RpiR family transcriptional regulator [Fredinandcohnia onubensis]